MLPHQQQQQPPYQQPQQPYYQPPQPSPYPPQQQQQQSPYQQPQQPSPYQQQPQYQYQNNNVQYQQPAPPPPLHHPGAQNRPPRLDYRSMPSVPDLIRREIALYEASDKCLSIKAPATLPPLITTLESKKLELTVRDNGCARPNHMRSTIYQVPVTKEMLDASGLEFSVVIRPFDSAELNSAMVPIIEDEIQRCNRCGAFENPFSTNGSCGLCDFENAFTRRPEHESRPQTYLGSYEFRNLTPEYYRDKVAITRRPHIIFAIETTVHSRHVVEYLSKNLAQIIKDYFPRDFMYPEKLYPGSSYPGYKFYPLVGFATYNSKITIYDVANGGHAYVVSDVASLEECAPTPKFLLDPYENFENIQKFMSNLLELCNDQTEQQAILGPVIEAVLKTCLHDTSNYIDKQNSRITPAGKLYIFQSTLPTSGDEKTPGRLSARRNIDDMKKQLGTETEAKVLSAEGQYYENLAKKCIKDYATGVELYLFPPNPRVFLNVATIGDLACLTGTGIVNKYHLSSLNNFREDLKFSLESTMAFDALMRVRSSRGITPDRYIGNLHQNADYPKQLEMSAVNANSNFVVQMKYDDKISENDFIIVQFAMLYTSVCGERRVRVHNLALTACQSYEDLYKMACCDTLMNVFVRDAVKRMRSSNLTPKGAKEHLTKRLINLLTTYRKHCTQSSTSSAQLILPEGLKMMPVYLCGALKCDAIDGGMEMFPDDKVLAQINLHGATPFQSQVTVYPRMFAIDACSADDEDNEFGLTARLTRCLHMIIEAEKGQCYVLENGHYLFIFFPNTELGQNFLASVYGQYKDSPDLTWDIRQQGSNETKFLEFLIEQIVSERRRSLTISIIRQGRDKLENVFNSFLYEGKKRPDDMPMHSKLDNVSYENILCYLHNEIMAKLAQ